jgi:SAM-dependent methyltransferase
VKPIIFLLTGQIGKVKNMNKPIYYKIAAHYENCLAKYGITAKGMDWPNEDDLKKRFNVMLNVIKNKQKQSVSLLDIGCGVGFLLDYINDKKLIDKYQYKGIDISSKMIEIAKLRYPDHDFEVRDILENPLPGQSIDYIVMNGVLTERVSLTYEQMKEYSCSIIKAAYDTCIYGIAFNVMSTHVDWYRNDLFHWSLDSVVSFLVKECSRNIVIRMDYGLYEFTVYVYRNSDDGT